jgi:uncharacterized membrane-anchored protein
VVDGEPVDGREAAVERLEALQSSQPPGMRTSSGMAWKKLSPFMRRFLSREQVQSAPGEQWGAVGSSYS